MYNYKTNVCYKDVSANITNMLYRQHFLIAHDTKCFNDLVFTTQDEIFELFKNNDAFIKIIEKGKKFGFHSPMEMDEKIVFTMLFSYDYYEDFHLCLKDLFTINDISEPNFTKIINLLS
jgi:hypothetical protein